MTPPGPGDKASRRHRLLIGSANPGKLREYREILQGLDLELVAPTDLAPAPTEPPETAATFAENAAAKARAYAQASGLLTVADDSGLEVLSLGGRPGVRTKRWSGRSDLSGRALDAANNAKMLSELAGVADRRARYVCVAAYIDADGERVFRGESAGRMLDAPRGAGGFGYDPLFLSDDLGLTFAEATREQKERVSHRGRAFAQLAEWMSQRGTPR